MTAKTIARSIGLALLIALAFAALLLVALVVPMPSDAAGPPPTGPTGSVKTECQKVKASKWNHLVRIERQLDGHSAHRTRSKPICTDQYKVFKRHVKKVRADCLRKVRRPDLFRSKNAGITGASYYSYGDSGGIVGACGLHLLTPAATNSFAVLQTGNVPSRCGQRFYFHRNGVTRSGIQADTGYGGGSAGGYPRTFDFWNPPSGGGLARALGLTSDGLGAVSYSRRNCWIK